MKKTAILLTFFISILHFSCSDDAANSNTDDSDSISDTGVNSDSDTRTESDVTTETDSIIDSDTNSDTNSDSDSSSDINPDSGFGCEISGGGVRSGYYTFELQMCDINYNVQTNPWGGAEQTIEAGNEKVFEVLAMQEPAGGNSYDVAAFPSVYRGTAQGGHPTTDSGMPISVADIINIPTGLKTNSLDTAYTGNTTFDVYFTNSENYTGGGPDLYLMVWFHSIGINPINGADEAWNCGADSPTYIQSCTGSGNVTINGKEFVRFIGLNWTSPVISYAPVERFDEWEFNLKDFIDDAVSQNVISTDMYLQSIQAGFELIKGGTGLKIEDFYTQINP